MAAEPGTGLAFTSCMRRTRPSCRSLPELRRFSSILVLCLLAACGGPPAPSEAAQTIGSWGATAHFVTDRWNHSAVTRKFAVVTLDRAGSELSTLAQKVAQIPDTASGRAPLVSGLKEIRAAIAAMDSAATHDDHAGAARVAPRLAAATAQMDTLGDRLEAHEQQEQSK